MVEAARHHGNRCTKTALKLVGNCQSQQKVRSACVDMFGDGDGELGATATVNFAVVNLKNSAVIG